MITVHGRDHCVARANVGGRERVAGGAVAVAAAIVAAALAAACAPTFDDPPSLVTGTRVLALIGEPPEVAPGAPVTFRAVVASAADPVDGAAPTWALCTVAPPLDQDDVVAPDCLGDGALRAIGTGGSVSGSVPADACARFGPEVPPQPLGRPPLRPRDPDATGGFYQPVRALLDGTDPSFALERLRCGLAGATPDIAARFRASYAPNRNPRVAALTASLDGAPLDLGHVPVGRTVTLAASWDVGSVERYPVFDRARQALASRREAMRVSWFATGGRFPLDHTGREEDDPATDSVNAWTTPTRAGAVALWVVLRDSRGGADVLAARASVE